MPAAPRLYRLISWCLQQCELLLSFDRTKVLHSAADPIRQGGGCAQPTSSAAKVGPNRLMRPPCATSERSNMRDGPSCKNRHFPVRRRPLLSQTRHCIGVPLRQLECSFIHPCWRLPRSVQVLNGLRGAGILIALTVVSFGPACVRHVQSTKTRSRPPQLDGVRVGKVRCGATSPIEMLRPAIALQTDGGWPDNE
ncbi:hypothetical protein CI41S_17760 [Bradyrhizobium ivorense]|nr:hypothetical protein CI41S_17760 [Bradyrhizobium ivorense]